jgi:hypothetical protein
VVHFEPQFFGVRMNDVTHRGDARRTCLLNIRTALRIRLSQVDGRIGRLRAMDQRPKVIGPEALILRRRAAKSIPDAHR